MLVSPINVDNSDDLLKAASATAIEDTLRRMRMRLRRWKRWLTQTHQYLNVVKKLEPKGIKNPSIDGDKLAEYIAASIPLHVADGWSYLARAFDSIKTGDRNTAVHLAYYAELRAAMSLLASEGVGVFNRRHVAIGPACTPTMWRSNARGTHVDTWKLLGSWADDPIRVNTILTAIEVESWTIDEWFDAANIGSFAKYSVAREWLTAWSIDLKYFSRDREFRNHVSYSPSRISPIVLGKIDSVEDIIEPIFSIWDALAPTTDSGGAAIDRVLLQRALTRAHELYLSPGEDWADFLGRLDGIASDVLQNQLKDSGRKEHYVFDWADHGTQNPPVQAVLARATLLLRIANGVCARRLAAAGVRKQDLQFWWTAIGEDGGLWSDYVELDSFADLLWPDVDFALENSERELDYMNSSGTVYDIGQILGPQVALTQFTRVPLWLLGVD